MYFSNTYTDGEFEAYLFTFFIFRRSGQTSAGHQSCLLSGIDKEVFDGRHSHSPFKMWVILVLRMIDLCIDLRQDIRLGRSIWLQCLPMKGWLITNTAGLLELLGLMCSRAWVRHTGTCFCTVL